MNVIESIWLTDFARRKVVLGALAMLFVGCENREKQVVVKLEVSDLGAYSIDGISVDNSNLVATLNSKRQADKSLSVHVVGSPRASYQAVKFALEACQAVGASVGLVGNVLFLPGAASSSGA